MNNWQEWVVGVLIVLCIARVIYGIYIFFRRTRESANPCDSCVSGCELKDMMEKKPELAMRVAVRGMMPRNVVTKDSLKRLHIYAGDTHEHQAQKPELYAE